MVHGITVFVSKCMIAIQSILTSDDSAAPFPTPATTKIELSITGVPHQQITNLQRTKYAVCEAKDASLGQFEA
jgi:hypothetical protein